MKRITTGGKRAVPLKKRTSLVWPRAIPKNKNGIPREKRKSTKLMAVGASGRSGNIHRFRESINIKMYRILAVEGGEKTL